MARAAEHSRARPSRIRLAVSSCLLGQRVRYDGGDQRNRFVTDVLARHVDLVPICPEVGVGMGVPRAPIHLIGNANAPRAVGVAEPRRDVTDALQRYAQQKRGTLADVSGYIFKSRSPSCGIATTPIKAPGQRRRLGAGIFAAAVTQAYPLMPVIEDHHLDEPQRRDAFLERVFVYARWQAFRRQRPTVAKFRHFHASQRLAVLAHGRRQLAALEDSARQVNANFDMAHLDDYAHVLMTVVRFQVTRRRRLRVSREIFNRLAPCLSANKRRALQHQLERYCEGHTPWPLVDAALQPTRLVADDGDLLTQTCLSPWPAERALRRPQ